MIASFSFATLVSTLTTIGYSLAVLGLILWPLYIVAFTFKNQDKLSEPEFKQKYQTLYQDINTDEKESLVYNAVFCARRFNIVLINVLFSQNDLFETNHYLLKIVCFLVIQSAYVMYILEAKLHAQRVNYILEIVNESVLIILIYMMICYSGMGNANQEELIQESMFLQVIIFTLFSIFLFTNLFVLLKKVMLMIKQ